MSSSLKSLCDSFICWALCSGVGQIAVIPWRIIITFTIHYNGGKYEAE